MGPLKGMKVVEVGGIGPGPFGAQMLADMGADIIRVDRRGGSTFLMPAKYSLLHRSRRSVAMDLKKPAGVEAALQLIEQADALIEGFRPGVMESKGLVSDVCLKRNPQLVYGRMTGWGQEGPLSRAAGHDINYISLSGVLHAIGRKGEKPLHPLNLVGDFGGGGMFLAFGVMCGVFEARESGRGQVVDAAMVDGSALLMTSLFGGLAAGGYNLERGTNFIDGGSHFYDSYETADGKWISVGSIEPQFYALLVELSGVDDPDFDIQMDMEKWPDLKDKLAAVFKTKTRDEWCDIMEGSDVCFAPVLDMKEAMAHPHNAARKTFVDVDGITQPAPGPRFSRTPPEIRCPPPEVGQHNEEALADWGFSRDEIESLKDLEVL